MQNAILAAALSWYCSGTDPDDISKYTTRLLSVRFELQAEGKFKASGRYFDDRQPDDVMWDGGWIVVGNEIVMSGQAKHIDPVYQFTRDELWRAKAKLVEDDLLILEVRLDAQVNRTIGTLWCRTGPIH